MQESALLRPDPLPVERILFDGALVRVGAFRCPATNPLFEDSGPIINPIFVFPRTSVWIAHEGRDPFVSDPTISTLYNRGQVYRRKRLSPVGDSCDWFAVSPEILAEICSVRDSRVAEHPDHPFRRTYVPVDRATYLFQRSLIDRLEREVSDGLYVEEQAIWLASRVAGCGAAATGLPPDSPGVGRASNAHRDHGEHAREVLAERYAERLSLGEIAALVGVSVFHLCRVFRRTTGLTLHEYRTELRLRHALERLAQTRPDLTRIALEVGFSSHSHFTDAFRRGFGLTPSAFVRSLRFGRGRATRAEE